MVAWSGAWPDVTSSVLEEWMGSIPSATLSAHPYERIVVSAGALMFLQATGNAVVRWVLLVLGSSDNPEHKLQGGRVIGPLERTLIFSLALAGQPTAAALVISAKGLLRFPEISKLGGDIHAETEYFLVGSLTSWALALGAAGLVAL